MRAMVFERVSAGVEPALRLMQMDRPAPDVRELLVRVHYCGLDRRDLSIVEGHLKPKRLPVILGHQFMGKVAAVGSQCQHRKIGDWIGTGGLGFTCGNCSYCVMGEENLCERAHIKGFDSDGGLAEYVLIHEDYAIPLGDNPAKEAMLILGAGALAHRAIEKAALTANSAVGILGMGSVGHLALQLAAHKKAQTYVVSRSMRHRDLAKRLGANAAIVSTYELPRKLDSAILFAPSEEMVLSGLASLRRGGTLIIVANTLHAIPALSFEKHLAHEKNIQVVSGHTRNDSQQAYAAFQEKRLKPHIDWFQLDKANEALSALKDSELAGAAGVVLA